MWPFRKKKTPRADSDIPVEDAIRHLYGLLSEANRDQWKTTPIGDVLRWHLTLGEQAQLAATADKYPASIQQIAISALAAEAFRRGGWNGLPGHAGLQVLAGLLAQAGVFPRAITLCEEAARQGWAGDWPHRIERYGSKAQSANEEPSNGISA